MKVLFLGGLGRSGTTLLERVVGELPSMVALGEVVHLWERSLIHDEPCGCGERFSACPFWRQVGKTAFGDWSRVDPQRVLHLRGLVDRTRYIPLLARRSLPQKLTGHLDEYLDYYQRLYAAARVVSGASVVVDSSKHPSLAFCLRHGGGIDLRVAHCVRDSRAVAYSWTKQVARPESAAGDNFMTQWSPTKTSMYWDAHNAAFEALRYLGTPTLLLRYETFVAHPRATAKSVAEFAGVSAPPDSMSFVEDHQVVLSAGHTTSGNPMRFKTGPVPIRADEKWRQSLPVSRQRMVTALTLPLLHRYGYPMRRGSRLS